jgi:hypothetical protein
MHLKLGEVSYIIVSSPDMAKEIMKTHDLIFCDRPNLLLSTILGYNATNIAFSTYGEYWRQLRKICVIELLSAKRVQSFRYIREEEVSNLVKSISASEGSVVNLTQKVMATTYGITAQTAFGKRNIHQEAYKLAIGKALSLLGGVCIADLYPSIKLLRRMSWAKTKLEKATRDLDVILQDIIDDHRSSRREESKDEDLVDVLLNIQQENYHTQHPLTDDNLKAVIQVSLQSNMLTSFTVKVFWREH